MSQLRSSSPAVAPDVVRYLNGAPPESRQFDFLIGDRDVAATRFNEDGSVLHRYRATWNARSLNEGRMVMDDFKAHAPTGQAISSYVTLRTYAEASQRWEMTGLAALQPAASMKWNGRWTGDTMQLDAVGNASDEKKFRTKILFTEIEQQRLVWESRSSRDDGQTWMLTASLIATRRPR